MARRPDYNYSKKQRDWRQDRARARWKIAAMLIVGLGIAGLLIFMAVSK